MMKEKMWVHVVMLQAFCHSTSAVLGVYVQQPQHLVDGYSALSTDLV